MLVASKLLLRSSDVNCMAHTAGAHPQLSGGGVVGFEEDHEVGAVDGLEALGPRNLQEHIQHRLVPGQGPVCLLDLLHRA